jgi:hypothetical protein
MYGDYTFGCLHGKEYFSTFIDGETIEKLIPSFKLSLTGMPTNYKPVNLYKSLNNSLGQIACLMSAQSRSLVKINICLRCYLTAAQE